MQLSSLLQLAAAMVLVLCGPALHAQSVQPVPALTSHVVDTTATLDEAQRQAIDAKLAQFERTKGSQVVVLMVSTTQPEDIAGYANRVGNSWKIGRKDVGDGVLLVVAKEDRKVRIEVAKTLEGAIPDLAAKQIIDNAITPAFRAGDYAGGLSAGADQIVALINGEPLPAPAPTGSYAHDQGDSAFTQLGSLALFVFLFVPVIGAVARGILGRKAGGLTTGVVVGGVAWFVTASLIVAGVVAVVALLIGWLGGAALAGGRRSSGLGAVMGGLGGFGGGSRWGGGSGGGGGGFSSGGGGDFGGGGASGNW